MRTLFVTKHLRVGGAQRNWTILLPGLARRGFDVSLLTLEGEGELFEDVRAEGIPVGCAGMRSRLDLRALLRAFAHGGPAPDLVVSHDERSHLVARRLARRARALHVASDHGGPGFRLKPHRELVLPLVAPGFAATVTVTERRVPELIKRGFRRERVHVIGNGVDAEALQPARGSDELRSELGLAGEAFVALLPAVLRPEKRADRFVRAVSLASASEPRIRGLVAGYGPGESTIRRLAAATHGAVAVLGHRSDVPDLINASDAVCLTSELEGEPYAALEAMALARPVVAMRAGALEDVVLDAETGVLVPAADERALADALVALARDPARARALGAAGRERQRARFDADRMCDAYAALFRGLAAARSSTATSAGSATAAE